MLDRQFEEEVKTINITERWWFGIITNKDISDIDFRVISSLLCFMGKKKFKEVSVEKISEYLCIPKETIKLSIEHLKENNIIEASNDRWSTGYRFTGLTGVQSIPEIKGGYRVQEEINTHEPKKEEEINQIIEDRFDEYLKQDMDNTEGEKRYTFDLHDIDLTDNELLVLEHMCKYLVTDEFKILIQREIAKTTGVPSSVVSKCILILIQERLIEMRKIGKTNSYRINGDKLLKE